MKVENERFSFACSLCRQNLKFGNFTWSLRRVPHRSARAARLFMLFEPMISLFCDVVVAVAVVKS